MDRTELLLFCSTFSIALLDIFFVGFFVGHGEYSQLPSFIAGAVICLMSCVFALWKWIERNFERKKQK